MQQTPQVWSECNKARPRDQNLRRSPDIFDDGLETTVWGVSDGISWTILHNLVPKMQDWLEKIRFLFWYEIDKYREKAKPNLYMTSTTNYLSTEELAVRFFGEIKNELGFTSTKKIVYLVRSVISQLRKNLSHEQTSTIIQPAESTR